jgi:radical SAM protein with 4Fe4S-binding SPASM domain
MLNSSNGLITLLSRLKSAFAAPAGLPAAGLYHYLYEGDQLGTQGERSRVHLRIDTDHSGLLLVNASRVIHLNPTAAFLAYLALEKIPQKEALRAIRRTYAASAAQVAADFAQIRAQIEDLIRPDGVCPACQTDIEITAPFSARPSAPYRMDLALTYRCNNDCPHCYNARPRSYPELSTADWFKIIDQLWEIGIPHVVFTGGEPTLRNDLPDLIAHAERNGQITGLNTNARRLNDLSFVEKLVNAGLDHVQITLESHDANIHDHMVASPGAWKQTVRGLRNVLDTPLFVMTNTTMLRENSPSLGRTLEFLAETGVPTIGLNALIYSGRGAKVGTGLDEKELAPLLELARDHTDRSGQRLIWYTPTQYCSFDPMQLELGVKGCTAALYNMCIEPDGKVIPCQSYYVPLGTVPHDSWEAIWNHDLAVRLRERRYAPPKCSGCALLSECGGGCPLMLDNMGPDTG